MEDGAVILIAITVFLYLWIFWLFAELVGEALLPYMSRIVRWVARKVGSDEDK